MHQRGSGRAMNRGTHASEPRRVCRLRLPRRCGGRCARPCPGTAALADSCAVRSSEDGMERGILCRSRRTEGAGLVGSDEMRLMRSLVCGCAAVGAARNGDARTEPAAPDGRCRRASRDVCGGADHAAVGAARRCLRGDREARSAYAPPHRGSCARLGARMQRLCLRKIYTHRYKQPAFPQRKRKRVCRR